MNAITSLSSARLPSFLLAAAAGLLVARDAPAQPDQGPPPGLDREAMWYAPTAEDWAKPCLVTFQRTFEDAVAVARETGEPILICVNMDGEIASEHYAGVRYRQPETAALYEPYVCVIASVYRHTPRDHDEQGRRILCPRFGSVTCGEHIAIEPGLYERFFDGRRIAPRHIMVELDGAEVYDVYYAWDTDSVFQAIREGVAGRPPGEPLVRGDRSILERVASREVTDRQAVESRFLDADANARQSLLDAAAALGEDAPVELLRLAMHGLDADQSGQARRVLARSDSPEAVGLITEALRTPLDTAERDALIGALARIGDSTPRARTLALAHRGLAGHSSAVDVEAWSNGLGSATYQPSVTGLVHEERLADPSHAFETDDPVARLELAEAFLAKAAAPGADPALAELAWIDARRAAREAEALGAAGWRVDAALAEAHYRLGEVAEARARAEAAMQNVPEAPQGRDAMIVLGLFAEARKAAIVAAIRESRDWPAQWLTDVNAAYRLLARHPLGTDTQVAAHYDFLKWFDAAAETSRILDEGLEHFPESPALHARLRGRILHEQGVDALEPAYAALLAEPDAAPRLRWFAGYASFVAAEHHRRHGAPEPAVAAYERAIAAFDADAAAHPEDRASADLHAALALAAIARVAYEAGDDAGALERVVASFARSPDAAATPDGLNLSPVDTAKVLLARLKERGQGEAAARLEAALADLDPRMLELPAYERDLPPGAESPREGRRRGRGARRRG